MTDAEIDTQARIIWNYMRLDHVLKPSEAIFVLCSFDTRVADYAAQLFLDGYGQWLIFSGNGQGRISRERFAESEAETFADIALRAGVPKDKIIIENQANNSGENIRFTYAHLKKQSTLPHSLILVQKPYMGRRTYATFKKQWPDSTTNMLLTSPPYSYEECFNKHTPKHLVVSALVGGVQRMRLYPKQGFQIEQEIPAEVWEAYKKLARAGFTKYLLPEHSEHEA